MCNNIYNICDFNASITSDFSFSDANYNINASDCVNNFVCNDAENNSYFKCNFFDTNNSCTTQFYAADSPIHTTVANSMSASATETQTLAVLM